MKNRLKNSRKGGFTLVELIVVLVILAILAALLIPALTGYIDKAKQKQIIAQTRQAVMAAQTLYDEEYGKGIKLAGVDPKNLSATNFADLKGGKMKAMTLVLAELAKGDLSAGTVTNPTCLDWLTNVTTSGGKIATLTWTPNGGKEYCIFSDTAAELYTVYKKP